jgi:hypothetical protein
MSGARPTEPAATGAAGRVAAEADVAAATDAAGAPVKLSLPYRRASGQRRTVLVGLDETDVWLVYDVPDEQRRARTGLLVERFGGYGEKCKQALAMAADYQAAQSAFHAAKREHFTCPNPLPRARRAPLAAIARDAARARHAVLNEQQPHPTAAKAA